MKTFSIIASSINPAFRAQFEANITATIGAPFELLIHDNRETKWGLAHLYNHYARLAKGDFLCFFHEDILFHTADWGTLLIDFFAATPNAGVVGFAGSTVKTRTPSGWENLPEATRIHVRHQVDGHESRHWKNPAHETFSRVVSIDGLAMITPRAVWEQHPFDEQTFRGFHLYDLDFSFAVAQTHANFVCHSIDVTHFSTGSYSASWYADTLIFHQKWAAALPFSIDPHNARKYEAAALYRRTRNELKHGWKGNRPGTVLKNYLKTPDRRLRYLPRLLKYAWRAWRKG